MMRRKNKKKTNHYDDGDGKVSSREGGGRVIS